MELYIFLALFSMFFIRNLFVTIRLTDFSKLKLLIKGTNQAFNISGIMELVISLAMIPVITAVLDSLELEGTAGQIITAIAPFIPLSMTFDAIKRLV